MEHRMPPHRQCFNVVRNFMTTEIKLIDFIRTGYFGLVHLGMTRDKVVSLLGQGDEGYKGSLWYGSYELFFDEENDTLTGIQNDHLFNCEVGGDDAALFRNDRFQIDPWFLSSARHVTYRECIKYISEAGVSFVEKHEWDAYKIIFDSGVYLSFDNFDSFWEVDGEETRQLNVMTNEKEGFVLEGIRFYKN